MPDESRRTPYRETSRGPNRSTRAAGPSRELTPLLKLPCVRYRWRYRIAAASDVRSGVARETQCITVRSVVRPGTNNIMTVNSTPVDVLESQESQPLVDKKPGSAWRRVSVGLVVAALLVAVGALYTQAYQVLPSARFLGHGSRRRRGYTRGLSVRGVARDAQAPATEIAFDNVCPNCGTYGHCGHAYPCCCRAILDGDVFCPGPCQNIME